jgi:pimeloyl-ACP methyl ester carboxylesterase
MKTQRPAWIDNDLFPFESKWITIDEHEIHYIDEGQGEIILFAHGTPEWSFGYRDLIKDLKKNFRCIAVDMVGFGLSEKPQDTDYTCVAHAKRLEKFINILDLKNISIVANDFGGGIAMSYVLGHPENIRKVFLFNTWMWSLKNDKHFSNPAKIMNSWFGKLLYLSFNFPVNVIMPSAFGNKKLLTKSIHDHYKKPLPQGQRTALYIFAKELMDASDWWEDLWSQLDKIDQRKFFIFWGLRDKFIPLTNLEKWKTKLPHAKFITFEKAGHFVQEENSQEMAIAIRDFEQQPSRKESTVLFAGVK